MNGQNRSDIRAGLQVDIVLKKRSAYRKADTRNGEGYFDQFFASSAWNQSAFGRRTGWACQAYRNE